MKTKIETIESTGSIMRESMYGDSLEFSKESKADIREVQGGITPEKPNYSSLGELRVMYVQGQLTLCIYRNIDGRNMASHIEIDESDIFEIVKLIQMNHKEKLRRIRESVMRLHLEVDSK